MFIVAVNRELDAISLPKLVSLTTRLGLHVRR